MAVRERLDRIAAWFGFGVGEDDYYEEEEEEDRRYANDAHANGGRGGDRYAGQSQPSHLRPVPDQRPTRVSVVEPASFNDAQNLADRYKRQQPVILNLQNVDGDLSRRMVDFCSGLTYAMDGNIQSVANRVFLLTPRDVEVSAEERKRIAERAFFNQL